MSTATQLNWYGKYLSVVAELTAMRREIDAYQAEADKLRAAVMSANHQRDVLAGKLSQLKEALK